jgi:hypothetical protein
LPCQTSHIDNDFQELKLMSPLVRLLDKGNLVKLQLSLQFNYQLK